MNGISRVRRDVLEDVREEMAYGERRFGPYNSNHEAIAVIREEYLELEREVFHGDDRHRAFTEAIQLAAVATRFARDLDPRWDAGNRREADAGI